jgi:hypothetical protein
LFLFENIEVHKAEKVWKNWWAHMKVFGQWGDKLLHILFWWKGSESESLSSHISVIGKIKRDTFNGGWYVDGEEIVEPH